MQTATKLLFLMMKCKNLGNFSNFNHGYCVKMRDQFSQENNSKALRKFSIFIFGFEVIWLPQLGISFGKSLKTALLHCC